MVVVLALHVFTTGSGAASTHQMAYKMRITKIMTVPGPVFQLHVVCTLIRIPGRLHRLLQLLCSPFHFLLGPLLV